MLAVVLAGCGGVIPTPSPPVRQAASSTPGTAAIQSTPPSATLPSETPWQHELLNLEPDGTRSLASALRLFAMAVGPIPGVDVEPATAGTVDSASPAIQVIETHLAQLSEVQRDAVAHDLDLPAASTEVTPRSPGDAATGIRLAVARSAGPAAGIVAAGMPYTDLEAEATQEEGRAQAKAAEYFGPIPDVHLRFHAWEGEAFLTFFNPTSQGCDVFVNTATANVDRFATRRALTLDVVHCFQNWVLTGNSSFADEVPAWAWNGPAEYIALELWPPFGLDSLAWSLYLAAPDKPLFRRTYDAIGFFAQAQSKGYMATTTLRAVLAPADNAERFAAVGAASPDFLKGWASELARTGTGDWGFDGPGIPPRSSADTPRQPLALGNGTIESISQQAYSNHLFALHSDADVVELDLAGYGRIGDGSVDDADLGPGYFCTTDRGCGPCPDGSEPSIHPTRLAADSTLAISGGTEGTSGTVSGHPLEDFCHAATPSPSGQAVQVKDIRTIEGHQITFVNMVACDGPWGHWDGEFYGISAYTRPMHFFVGGSGDATVTVTPGTAQTPEGVISVSGDVTVSIQHGGTTMVLSGTTNVVYQGPNGPLAPDHNSFSVSYPIEPADPGRCP